MSRTTAMIFALVALVALGAAGVSAQPYELHGSGTSNPSKFFWKAMDILEERARAPISMTYRSVGKGSLVTSLLLARVSVAARRRHFLFPRLYYDPKSHPLPSIFQSMTNRNRRAASERCVAPFFLPPPSLHRIATPTLMIKSSSTLWVITINVRI
jgi:hypothetical protein